MSYWFQPKKEDLSLDLDGKDLHIWLEQDDNGNVYASIPIETLLEFLKEQNIL